METDPNIPPEADPISPPKPLDYLAPIDDEPKRKAALDAASAAGILAALTVFAVVFAWIMYGIQLAVLHGDPNWKVPVALIACGIVPRAGVLYWKRKSRLFIIGTLIGFGVGLLIEGLCIAAMRR